MAAIGALLLRVFDETLLFMGDAPSWRVIPEAIAITFEKLTDDPRQWLTPFLRALVFAGLYVMLLKLLPLVGFDERQPAPQPPQKSLA